MEILNFKTLIIINDYTWVEMASYGGFEKVCFEGSSHLSEYQIQESHIECLLQVIIMITEAWFRKAERHVNICEIYFEMKDYPFIVNSCFLAMYSVIKALFVLKNIECKTLEGLIYLLKIYYVDEGLFDRGLFKFFCKVNELNSEFLQINWDIFDEKIALEVFNNTNVFVDYSKDLFDELSKCENCNF